MRRSQIDMRNPIFEEPARVKIEKTPAREKKESFPTTFGAATEKSEEHKDNEDAYTVSTDEIGIYDGMGNSLRAKEAAQTVKKFFEEQLRILPPQPSAEALAEKMAAITREASKNLYDASFDRSGVKQGLDELGSTVSFMKVWTGKNQEKKAVIVHVGDSRIYRLREGKISQLTEDESVSNWTIEHSGVSPEGQRRVKEALDTFENDKDVHLVEDEKILFDLAFKKRNSIRQALGKESVEPRTYIYSIQPGDEYFAMSDGISDPLTNKRIERSLAGDPERTMEQKARDLIMEVHKANAEGIKRKKFDDKTVVGIGFSEELPDLSADLMEMVDDEGEFIDPDDLFVVKEVVKKPARPPRKPTAPPPLPRMKKAA